MGRAFEYRRAAKEKRWSKMSSVFPKLGRLITIAAREGDNPETNSKLRLAISNAKAQNMPKDNIEAAIKRAGSKEGNLELLTYEGKSAHGVLLLIECATDNATRTIANLKSYFNKASNSSILPNGSVDFMFKRKSVFELDLESIKISLEDLELALIDYGLEELSSDEGVVVLHGEYSNFKNILDGLASLEIAPIRAELEYHAVNPISLSDEQFNQIAKLLERIEEDDDVQNVWSNIA